MAAWRRTLGWKDSIGSKRMLSKRSKARSGGVLETEVKPRFSARTMFDNWIDWAIYKAVSKFYECLNPAGVESQFCRVFESRPSGCFCPELELETRQTASAMSRRRGPKIRRRVVVQLKAIRDSRVAQRLHCRGSS